VSIQRWKIPSIFYPKMCAYKICVTLFSCYFLEKIFSLFFRRWNHLSVALKLTFHIFTIFFILFFLIFYPISIVKCLAYLLFHTVPSWEDSSTSRWISTYVNKNKIDGVKTRKTTDWRLYIVQRLYCQPYRLQ